MKALIIEEKEIEHLFERLKLENYKLQGHMNPEDEIFRHYNYVLRTWLAEQGM